jgi:N-acetylmuramoyl-L-alanine amidase
MHKQFLSTAFASILALAILTGVVTPEVQGEAAPETSFEITDIIEETAAPETESETAAQTEQETAPETVPEETESEEGGALLPPILPEGAQPLSLYINGRATENGFAFEHDGEIWIPIDGFCALFDSGKITGEAGKCYIESGDRLIPCSKSDCEVTVRDYGTLCAPIEALMSAAGLRSTEIVGNEICIWGVPTFPEADDVYSYEDLYWLSRIISAEARGEPFVGQLAVGTVVINRTRSDYYPDTIYKVIFDKVGGTQFTPASTGSVYREPTESSVIAAKLCLEGFSLDPNILFFFNSSIAAGSWITANREYTMTVGRHDFYS